ncbi:MAG: MFS transporter [Halobacteriales archaeon]|nr:MFS transporter [Halobacteriales archaeon]
MAGVGSLRTHVSRTVASLRGEGRGWLLVVVALGWFIVLGMRFALPALLPQIKADFGIDNATAGLAVTLIWITYAGMQFPAGVIVDRVGERWLMVTSMALAAVSVLLFSLLSTFVIFLAVCVLFGLGTGLYGPPRATVISNTFLENDGTAFGLVLATGSIGAAALPVLASQITVHLGWRAAFGLSAPIFLLIGLGLWRWVPRQTATVGTDGSGTENGVEDGDGDEDDRTVLADAGAVRDAMMRRSVIVAMGAVMLMLFTFQGLTAFFPTYLVETKGIQQSTAATLFGVLFICGALFQSIAGTIADRIGYARTLLIIAGVSVIPMTLLPLVDGVVSLAAIAVVLGVRLAIGPVSNAYILRILPPEVQGSTWGLIRTVFFTVGSTGSIVVGALADRALFDEAFLLLAGLTAVAAVFYWFLPERDSVSVG